MLTWRTRGHVLGCQATRVWTWTSAWWGTPVSMAPATTWRSANEHLLKGLTHEMKIFFKGLYKIKSVLFVWVRAWFCIFLFLTVMISS